MKISRVLSTTALVVALTLSTAQVALAEQSTRWEGTGDKWRVRTEDGSGYLQNQWFHDLDNSWYMLGNDSYMYSGIITDPATGASYYLDTRHEGHYGRMVVENGTYSLNGKQIALTFNNANPSDATYGAIVSGLSELREAGILETQKGTQQAQTSTNSITFNTGNAGFDAWANNLSEEDKAIVASLPQDEMAMLKNIPNDGTRNSFLRSVKAAQHKTFIDEKAANELQDVMHGF